MAEECPLIDPTAVLQATEFFQIHLDKEVQEALAELYSECNEPPGKKMRTEEGGSRKRKASRKCKGGRRNRRGGGIYEMMRSLATGVGSAGYSAASFVGSLPSRAYASAVPKTKEGVVNYISATLWLIISGISYAMATSKTAEIIIYPSIQLWYSGECASFTASLISRLGFNPLCRAANWFNNLVMESLLGQPWALLAITSIATSPILSIYAARKLVHIVARSIVENTIAKFNTIDDATTYDETSIATGFTNSMNIANRGQLANLVEVARGAGDLSENEATEILKAMNSAPKVTVAAGGEHFDEGIPTRQTMIFHPRSATAQQARTSGKGPEAYTEELGGGRQRRMGRRSKRMGKKMSGGSKKMYGGKKRRSMHRRKTRRH